MLWSREGMAGESVAACGRHCSGLLYMTSRYGMCVNEDIVRFCS